MLTQHIALVSEIDSIPPSELTRGAAALQKQLHRDFRPLWRVDATVDAFVRLEDVPLGYWPVVVRDDIGEPGAAGVHLDRQGQPFALVQYSNQWTLTASHEVLEMTADPFGNRLRASQSVNSDQGRVEYLVEICDPCEDAAFSYHVNGIAVSDFYTPHFFDPVKNGCVRYSFTGAITEPRQVLKGGYLSWHDPVSDHWWQQTYFEEEPALKDLGALERRTEGIRSEIDRLTPRPETLVDALATSRFVQAAEQSLGAHERSTAARAESLRTQIDELIRTAGEVTGGTR
jgi:hypothetical protein